MENRDRNNQYCNVQYFLILVALLFCSCNQQPKENDNYPKDSTVSDIHGKPHDSLTYYFPASIRKDSQIVKIDMEDFMNEHFSSSLYFAKEPILSNYYLEHSIYRFLWLSSFYKPVIFTLNKNAEKVWLTITVLDKMTGGMPPIVSTEPRNHRSKPLSHEQEVHEQRVQDSINKESNHAYIIFNETKQLTLKEWNEFEMLLNNCSFWTTKPYERQEPGFDGSHWTIEAHLKNKYWFVSKYCPDENFRTTGQYLIDKSGITKEIYQQ